jgi:tetratricopeptide (TPR) repeat protein
LIANRNQEAARWFREAVTYRRGTAVYWFDFGIAYKRLNDKPAALAAYRKAADLGEPKAQLYIGAAYAHGGQGAIRNPAAVLELAQKAVNSERDHPDPSHLDTLAEAYFANQQDEEAVKTEQRAIALASAASSVEENGSAFQKSLAKYQQALRDRKPAAKLRQR